MKIYLISCEPIENGGGIYAFELAENGSAEKCGYFPCDRPMYTVRCKRGLCVLLQQPFENDENSGYFYVDEGLTKASQIKSTRGKVACHLTVDGEDAYIVNYLSGSIVKNGETVLQRTGSSVNPKRQSEPHPHFISQTPDGYFAVCDLGTDALAIYDNHLTLLSECHVPAGYGIRHAVFSCDGNYIYAVNELVPSVSVFAYRDGTAKIIDTIKIACENQKANGAAIRLSKDGKRLYVSLREENAVCVFSVSGEKIELLQKIDSGGDSPRDFTVCDGCLVICNEKSGNAVIYHEASRRYTDHIDLRIHKSI